MHGDVYWNRPVVEINPIWVVVFPLPRSAVKMEDVDEAPWAPLSFPHIFGTFKGLPRRRVWSPIRGCFLCGESGVYGSGPVS